MVGADTVVDFMEAVGTAGGWVDSLIEGGMAMVGLAIIGMATAGIITVGMDTGMAVSLSPWAAGRTGAIPTIIRRIIPTGTIRTAILHTDIIPTTAPDPEWSTLRSTTTFITTPFIRMSLRLTTTGNRRG